MDQLTREPTTGVAVGELWLQRIDAALNYRRNHSNGERAWKRYIDLYRGKHWALREDDDSLDSESPRERITVNVTGSTILNWLPFLVRKNPQFVCTPRRAEHVVSAFLQQEIINYEWRERGMQKHIRRAVLDALIVGHGIVKTGYSFEVDIPQHKNIQSLEYKEYIKKDAPYIRRISPFHFVFDPEAADYDLDSARWCAEIVFKPIRDVMESTLYEQSTLNKLRTGIYEATTVRSFLRDHEQDPVPGEQDIERNDADRMVLLEVWDKRSGKYYVFAHNVPEPLREGTWPYDYLENFPYKRLEFIPVVDDIYPIGIPAYIEDQQYELNRTRTAMFAHRRRFNRKYIIDRNKVPNQSEWVKIQEGEDGTVVVAEDANGAVVPIQDAPISPDQFNVESVIKQDIRELTGSDELMRGGQLPSRTTATEVGMRTRLMGLKLEDRVEQVDAWVVSIGRQVLQHIKANYTGDRVVRIAGPRGMYWVKYSVEDIRAEVDIEMESISADRHDPDIERQQAIQILQVFLQSAQLLMQLQVPVNWQALFKWVLEKFPNLRDTSRFFPPAAEVSPTEVQEGQGGSVQTGAAPPPAAVSSGLPLAGVPEQMGASGNVDSAVMGQLLGSLSGGSQF